MIYEIKISQLNKKQKQKERANGKTEKTLSNKTEKCHRDLDLQMKEIYIHEDEKNLIKKL